VSAPTPPRTDPTLPPPGVAGSTPPPTAPSSLPPSRLATAGHLRRARGTCSVPPSCRGPWPSQPRVTPRPCAVVAHHAVVAH